MLAGLPGENLLLELLHFEVARQTAVAAGLRIGGREKGEKEARVSEGAKCKEDVEEASKSGDGLDGASYMRTGHAAEVHMVWLQGGACLCRVLRGAAARHGLWFANEQGRGERNNNAPGAVRYGGARRIQAE